MTEQEKFMYEILGEISNSNIPIVFKGGLITRLILNEKGIKVNRATKDVDANWIGEPPTMEYLVNSLNKGFGKLQKSYKAVASRNYGDKRSAGVNILDKNTGRKIITMDIDIKPLIESKTYYYEETKIKGVLPSEILADKICVLSSDSIYKNRAKDIIDVFLLSQAIEINSKEILDICKKADRTIKSFDAFFNKTSEMEHAYNKLKGIEGKPEFKIVYEYLNNFIKPFTQKPIPDKQWNNETLSWNDVNRVRTPLSKNQLINNAKIISQNRNAKQFNKNRNKER